MSLRAGSDDIILYAQVIYITSTLFFQINLLSNKKILRLVLGEWSCLGNVKQVFLMIPPKCYFTKSAVNKWTFSPYQPHYPWFSKWALNLGLEKPMLINSAD